MAEIWFERAAHYLDLATGCREAPEASTHYAMVGMRYFLMGLRAAGFEKETA